MTYYEWINNFDSLKQGPRNDLLLDNLYNSTIELDGNMLYRFIRHINNLIRTRLKNTLEDMLYKISNTNDINILSLEIINIKKELAFAKRIINLPVIPSENKKKFSETLQKFANEINEAIEVNAENIDTTGEIITLIKNSKINVLED